MIKVTNPADGSLVGEAPFMSHDEIAAAIDRTCAAFPAWAAKSAKQRSELLRGWYDLVRANKYLFAELMVRENA